MLSFCSVPGQCALIKNGLQISAFSASTCNTISSVYANIETGKSVATIPLFRGLMPVIINVES